MNLRTAVMETTSTHKL